MGTSSRGTWRFVIQVWRRWTGEEQAHGGRSLWGWLATNATHLHINTLYRELLRSIPLAPAMTHGPEVRDEEELINQDKMTTTWVIFPHKSSD